MFSLRIKPHEHITEKYLEKLMTKEHFKVLEQCAQDGVDALAGNTPMDTGKTAASWSYEILVKGNEIVIVWSNDSVTRDGDPIVLLLQYGHGTGTGGYVQGRDFINPAIQPVFDNIVEEVWKVMRSL
jgi:hypothetical protein